VSLLALSLETGIDFAVRRFDGALAFSPISTRRRIASERVTALLVAHASMPATMDGGSRAETSGSLPVAGRPLFFGCTVIDLGMKWVYPKSKPEGSGSFRKNTTTSLPHAPLARADVNWELLLAPTSDRDGLDRDGRALSTARDDLRGNRNALAGLSNARHGFSAALQ
jgi:hypothetical protein